MMKRCWMISGTPPVFVLMGRFGDLCQMIPSFQRIKEAVGRPPVVITSTDYMSILQGASYVDCRPIAGHWYGALEKAKFYARSISMEEPTRYWNEDPKCEHSIGWNKQGWATLQCHGLNHGVNMALDPDYGSSMARRAGFDRKEFINSTLVFDRRNPVREAQFSSTIINPHRPTILVNLGGISSPFPHAAPIMEIIKSTGAHVVNLLRFRCSMIYDLLGAFDRAAAVVTCDTSTLHLAHGSPTPYAAFTVDGWTTSVPKGNCQLEIKYSRAMEQKEKFREWIQTAVNKS